jgi:hypothetical protein
MFNTFGTVIVFKNQSCPGLERIELQIYEQNTTYWFLAIDDAVHLFPRGG